MIRRKRVQDFFSAIKNICQAKNIEMPLMMEFHYEHTADIEIIISDRFVAQLNVKELKLLEGVVK